MSTSPPEITAYAFYLLMLYITAYVWFCLEFVLKKAFSAFEQWDFSFIICCWNHPLQWSTFSVQTNVTTWTFDIVLFYDLDEVMTKSPSVKLWLKCLLKIIKEFTAKCTNLVKSIYLPLSYLYVYICYVRFNRMKGRYVLIMFVLQLINFGD